MRHLFATTDDFNVLRGVYYSNKPATGNPVTEKSFSVFRVANTPMLEFKLFFEGHRVALLNFIPGYDSKRDYFRLDVQYQANIDGKALSGKIIRN